MTTIRTAAGLVVSLVLVTGCGAQEADPDPTTSTPEPAATTSTARWTGETIPDGTYAKTSTMKDVNRLGIPRRHAQDYLGKDGELHVELVLKGDSFAQLGDDDGEVMVQGDGGASTYDADGNWVTTSNSSGCPGCIATWAWSHNSDTLTLELIDTTEAGDPLDLLISRLIYEGTYDQR